MAASTRKTPLMVTLGLVLLGVAFAAVGALYLAESAAQLPSFFPGHQAGSTHHHLKHGLVAFALAILAWIGAWFTTGKSQPAHAA